MTMPQSLQHILDHAEEIAARFEQYEPRPEDHRDPAPLHRLRDAVTDRAGAEREIADGVVAMRDAGYSWSVVGGVLGTSAQAAQQRYGTRTKA